MRVKEKRKGGGGGGVVREVIRKHRLHEFSHFIIISLPCHLPIITLHIHALQLVNTVALRLWSTCGLLVYQC